MSAATACLKETRSAHLTATNLSNYWRHYGLEQAPFDESSHYAMYYSMPKWQAHLDFLKNLPASAETLVTITGTLGSGKSMLLSQYMAQADQSVYLSLIKGDSAIGAERLLDNIVQGFNIIASLDNIALKDKLEAILLHLQQRKQTFVLLIDDAHRLPLETLGAVVQLAQQQPRNHPNLYVILAGDNQLRSRLDNLFEDQGAPPRVPNLAMEPLTVEETKGYLKHRLMKAGLVGKMPLGDHEINRIYALSGGIPGRINRVTQQVMLDTLKDDLDRLSTKTAQPKTSKGSTRILTGDRIRMISLSLLVALGFCLWQFQDHWSNWFLNSREGINSVASLKQTQLLALRERSELQQREAAAKKQAARENQAQASAQAASSSTQHEPASTKKAQANAELAQVTALPSFADRLMPHLQVPAATSSHEKSTTTAAPVLVTPEVAKAELAAREKSSQPQAAAAQPAVQVATPAAVQQTAPTVATAAQSTSAEAEIAKPATQPPAPVAHSAAVSEAAQVDAMQQKLMAMQGYTLQLLGVSNLKDLQAFVNRNQLQDQALYLKTQYNGKPWYILLYGQYDSPAAARAALAKLPADLQQHKPWVKPLSSVHQLIHANAAAQ